MFVINFKLSGTKIAALLVTAIIAAVLTVAICLETYSKPNGATAVISDNLSAYDYISSFGPTVDQSALVTDEIVVPDTFSEVYENYNEIQKSQGFDLEKYKGCKLLRYTYPVIDYPDREKAVFVEILTYKGKVVGADIFSTDLEGFVSPLKG